MNIEKVNDEGVTRLANAVIAEAGKDYIKTLKRIQKLHYKAKTGDKTGKDIIVEYRRNYRKCKNLLADKKYLEGFLKSTWGSLLSPVAPKWLIEKMQKSVEYKWR